MYRNLPIRQDLLHIGKDVRVVISIRLDPELQFGIAQYLNVMIHLVLEDDSIALFVGLIIYLPL